MMLENSSKTVFVPHSTTQQQQQQKPEASTTTKTTTTAVQSVAPSSSTILNTNLSVLNESRWLFSIETIENSPSRRDGLTVEQEMNERQDAALFISDLAAQLKMVATSCLFLACKVEEQPRRLREFIEAIQKLFHRSSTEIQNSEEFRKNGEEIVALESCLLQTLGFNVLVQHAHTIIIKTCQMIKATRDLAEAAYLTATNSLILTNFCVKFSSEKIACFCIYLACKWTGLIIPTSSEGRQWYQYVKPDIVEQELEDISKEYLTIYDKCLPKIQKKLGKTKNVDSGPGGVDESSAVAVKRPHWSNGQPPFNNHKQQHPQVKKPRTNLIESHHHPPGSSQAATQQQTTHLNTTNQSQTINTTTTSINTAASNNTGSSSNNTGSSSNNTGSSSNNNSNNQRLSNNIKSNKSC